jgi:uncharacterized membrane protein YhaH (DUF805 family)
VTMGFQDAVRICFSKYATFSGRARRAEYWYFVLFGFLGSAIAGILDAALFGMTAPDVTLLGGIFSLVTLLPGLSVMVRRLHDTGRSGWWFWIILIPLIGLLVLLWFLITPGDEGTNDYGPDPIAGPSDAGGSRVPRVPR